MKILFVRSFNFGQDYITFRQGKSLQDKGIEVIYYNLVGKGILGYLKNVIPLRKFIKEENPDVIHSHYSLTAFVATLAFTRKPLIVSLMGSDLLSTNKILLWITKTLSAYNWKHTIVKSQQMFDVLSSKNASIIPNGVDLNTFNNLNSAAALDKLGWDKNKFHILFSSNPNRAEKNFPLAETAIKEFSHSYSDYELHFLNNLSTEEMVLHYNAANVLILTSFHEGSPNVIKEAMACNCPIITTNVGDVKQVIKNATNCFITDYSSEEICGHLKSIYLTKQRSNGREIINPYSSELIADKLIGIYNKFSAHKHHNFTYQRCAKGLWDTSVPGIRFDENGVSNFAKMQLSLMEQYPRGEKGMSDWEGIVRKMKADGKNKKYDCIIGISGGTDSSYLLHVAHQYKLRVLAVYLDNGWGSNIAVTNIEKMTTQLNFDLKTFVVDYEEVKSVLKSYILAGLPWIDSPTDIAIKSVLYKAAAKEGIKYALNGGDFRSEGKQPLTWTYSDTKQLNYLIKKFTGKKLKSYPRLSLLQLGYYGLFKKIKAIRPLYYLPYEKKKAKELLEANYGWIDYGGHHHENIFTKFAISYWLPKKFKIDKRIITYSAQVLSGELSKEKGLELLKELPYDVEKIQSDIEYLLKKLDLPKEDFQKAFDQPNNFFYDYPSYYPLIKRFAKIGKYVSGFIFGFKPGIFEALDQEI